jgi:acid stress chaperone HdeA
VTQSVVKRVAAAVAAAVSVITLIAGCSRSGDTTCKDYLAMSADDKEVTVAEMLKEREHKNASTGDVDDTRLILVGLCTPADKQETKISDLA